MNKGLLLIFAIGLSLVTVLADALIKKAALQNTGMIVKELAVAVVLYVMTVLGWYYVLRDMKLSTAGTIYTLSTIIFIVLVSIFYFQEKLSWPEGVGLIMAIVSIILLYRFS